MNTRPILFIVVLILVAAMTTLLYRTTQHADMNYYRGHRFFEKGEYDQAIQFYEKTLSTDPSRLDALRELAYSYQWTGRYEKAIEACKKVLSLQPQDDEIKKSLAQTLSWEKEYDKAIALYEEVVGTKDDLEAKRHLAELYIWNERPDKAKDILQHLLKDNPADSRSRLLLAKAMQYSGQAQEAVKIYEELWRDGEEEGHKPEEREEMEESLGEAYVMSEDYKSAIRVYRHILEREPENAEARIALAEVLSWRKEYAESIREYETLLAAKPGDLEIKEKLAEVYSWNKDYGKAEVLYREIVKKAPENMDAHIALGQLLVWEKRYTEAIRYFEVAISEKEGFDVVLLYGQALLHAGDYRRAKEVLRGVIEREPEDMDAKVYLADAFAYSKEYDEAVSLYREVLQTEENRQVKTKLADVLSWVKKYDQALDLYDEVLGEGDDVRVRLQKARVLGWAQEYAKSLTEYQLILDAGHDELVELEMNAKEAYWNNRIRRAIGYYDKLIEEDKKNVEAMFDLSQIYSYQSMWEEAIREYRRILERSPHHSRAREALEKVELISSHVSLTTGYDWGEADSKDRTEDIEKLTFSVRFRFPVNHDLSMDVHYGVTDRSFSDFGDVVENTGGIRLSYMHNPHW